jgi:hypothetical protein
VAGVAAEAEPAAGAKPMESKTARPPATAASLGLPRVPEREISVIYDLRCLRQITAEQDDPRVVGFPCCRTVEVRLARTDRRP